MKKRYLISTIAATVSQLSMAASTNLTASLRIGATFVDSETVDSDFSFSNFGSRVIWSGENEIGNELTAIGYLEFGFNPDSNEGGFSGIDNTRQAWGGLKADFGSVKIGAQYASFYDMVSGHTDIAWWGSCWTQFECGRETRVLKYNGQSGALSYSASLQGNPEDDGNDAVDQFEIGFNYTAGSLLFGLATSVQADDGVDEGGTLVGGIVKGDIGPLGLALGYQRANKHFADLNDSFSNLTLTGSFGDTYAVYNRGDSGLNNPQFFTLGHTLKLDKAALMYFEYQFVDDDTASDEENILRATYKYDFGIF